jgi:hypothetical protein
VASEPFLVAQKQQSRRGGRRGGFTFVPMRAVVSERHRGGISNPAVKSSATIFTFAFHTSPTRRDAIVRRYPSHDSISTCQRSFLGNYEAMSAGRRFPPPWSIEEHGANTSGSFATFAAILLASSLVRSFAADRRPVSPRYRNSRALDRRRPAPQSRRLANYCSAVSMHNMLI